MGKRALQTGRLGCDPDNLGYANCANPTVLYWGITYFQLQKPNLNVAALGEYGKKLTIPLSGACLEATRENLGTVPKWGADGFPCDFLSNWQQLVLYPQKTSR